MRAAPAAAAWLVAACGAADVGRPPDPGLTGLRLRRVDPDVVLPGTILGIDGESFVDDPWGTSYLRVFGGVDRLELHLPARYVDAHTMEVEIDTATFAGLGGDGAELAASALVEVSSAVDGELYRTTAIDLAIAVRSELAPRIDTVLREGVIFPDEPIDVVGSGLLLAGEGESVAVVAGCFTPEGGGSCTDVDPVEVALVGAGPFDREHARFAFAPAIAGISPGRFTGTVALRNRFADGHTLDSPALEVAYDLQRPIVYGASTDRASLGRYVTITGGGFVGPPDGATLLDFAGTFTPDDGSDPIAIDEVLLPEVVDGRTVRYVVNEDDGIGTTLDVRYQPGSFAGTLTPRIAFGAVEVTGDPAEFTFALAPVRQVVVVEFLPAYVESLRAFGLRAVDRQVRDRVLEVIRRDYATIGVDVRDAIPDDFAVYAVVEVGGPDPNGLGLLGYDNTPGKDTENQRLYDRIGGVNAVTQQDGYPGYGGVFIESLLGYSEHPPDGVTALIGDERFDALFDPLRPDTGRPVVSADFDAGEIEVPASGDGCPADDRRTQITCGIWALGSMVGSTVSHEVGHSLGLADPYGSAFHDPGDAPDRLMDADRPFGERAELGGEGPSRFCADEYAYLRVILPTDDADDPTPRPGCD